MNLLLPATADSTMIHFAQNEDGHLPISSILKKN